MSNFKVTLKTVNGDGEVKKVTELSTVSDVKYTYVPDDKNMLLYLLKTAITVHLIGVSINADQSNEDKTLDPIIVNIVDNDNMVYGFDISKETVQRILYDDDYMYDMPNVVKNVLDNGNGG